MEIQINTIEETTDKILKIIDNGSFNENQFKNISSHLQYYIYKLNHRLKVLKKCIGVDKEPFIILEYYLQPLLNKLQQIQVYDDSVAINPSSNYKRKKVNSYDDQFNQMYITLNSNFINS